ncbi:MAG: phosphoribosylformylglycinamidine synthase subunit PurL [Acidimicrobiia bacterium]|nr:phosphoribosylformylglycinamidine synthase subunit PurL [Acidimicrobiia bacterium]NNL98968.1 phosphoribosylformylglycinamidine synthase subunit PurL [Acidimicrobiia bacterium]RZV47209.1 MAG: phosphoribosylformylglycinamidine synthase subunit PurL [Acidimicrobiia bacterium]
MAETLHRQLGMTDDEFTAVNGILERPPADPELAMYSVMWSEHCSYKSSRVHLGGLPTDAPWVVVGPGENAGVVDIGDGWLAALRIESHNHPSFVEPYQGAATGVGGILRDIFTMGARPVGLWNQIRFGDLSDPHNRYLFNGVVAGIAGYGNAVGVPTLGGEVEFDPVYAGNPLVNVMCLGVLQEEQLVLGTAGPPGTVAVLLGAATGRDGIGGASVLASASFDEAAGAKRPSVQVGDPFEEKKLIEACLDLYDRRLVVGVQDLGAAGLSCAASEPAARAGVGMDLNLDAVHLREPDMTAPEMLMSESQERMMAFVAPDQVEEVLAVAARWEIEASVVGTVAGGDRLRVYHNGQQVVDVPAASLTDEAPILRRPIARPDWMDELWKRTDRQADVPIDVALLGLLDDPALGDRSWVYEQFDHMLFLNTVHGPGRDGSLIRVRGTSKGLAVSTDGNGRVCQLDPRRGAERLVYEAALNVAVVGARPLAVVDNLNFGNPEKPEVMWQFTEVLAGLGAACEALGVPIVGGNVSFYNETDGQDIYPTPVVGLLGMAEPIPSLPEPVTGGMSMLLIGPEQTDNLAGSAYQRVVRGALGGRPTRVDADQGGRTIEFAIRLTHVIHGAVLHDISQGGALMAAVELLIAGGVGAHAEFRSVEQAFGEDPHRFLCLVPANRKPEVEQLALEVGCRIEDIGMTGGSDLTIAGPETINIPLERLRDVWANAISARMHGAVHE